MPLTSKQQLLGYHLECVLGQGAFAIIQFVILPYFREWRDEYRDNLHLLP
jgi:hypothetical protein